MIETYWLVANHTQGVANGWDVQVIRKVGHFKPMTAGVIRCRGTGDRLDAMALVEAWLTHQGVVPPNVTVPWSVASTAPRHIIKRGRRGRKGLLNPAVGASFSLICAQP